MKNKIKNVKNVKGKEVKKASDFQKHIAFSLSKGVQVSQAIRADESGKSKVNETQLKEAHVILSDVIKVNKFTKDNIIDYCEKQVGKVDVNYKDLPLNKQRALPSLCAGVKKCSTLTIKQNIKQLACLDNLLVNLKLGLDENVIRIAYLAVYSNPKLETFEAQLAVVKSIK